MTESRLRKLVSCAPEEKRVETVVPAELAAEVVRALLVAHPYEAPAYELYPLAEVEL